MILFDVTLETEAATREGFLDLLRRTMAGAQREAGCIIYRFSVDLDNPLRFHLVELWEDEITFQAHAQGTVLRDFLRDIGGCGRLVSSTARAGPLAPFVFRRPT